MKNLNIYYRNETNRLATFSNWPLDFIDKNILAKTGMFYINKRDSVKCYFCSIEIGCWEQTDDPVEEHLKFSPSCPLLRRQESGNVPIDVTDLDQILPPISFDVCGNQTKIDLFWHPYELKYPKFEKHEARLNSFADKVYFHSSLAHKLADAGFFCYDDDSNENAKANNHVRVLCFSCGAEIQNQAYYAISNDLEAWQQHVLLLSRCSFVKFVWGQKFINKVLASPTENNFENKNFNAVATTKNSVGTSTDDKLCKICFEEEYSVAFLPCGHVVVCLKCALSVSRCPICRTVTNNIMRVYFS